MSLEVRLGAEEKVGNPGRENYHTHTHYFYRPPAAADDFFDTAVLKAALERTLSEFYPMAGRLKKDEKGRVEIDCNREGAVFTEAAADGDIDDLGEFTPRSDISLTPIVDYSQGISSFPLFLVQKKKLAPSLGVAMDHQVKDGISALHIITSWCEIARGLDVSVPPYMDRRLLAARHPPQPMFDHVEFHPPPKVELIPEADQAEVLEVKFSVLKLTREQLNILKSNCQQDEGNKPPYTSFEALTRHVWKCICKARGLPRDQKSKLTIIVDRRLRLRPSLPPSYFGNAVFKATHIGLRGEVELSPLESVVSKIRTALVRMDDEYLRSAIDYLEKRGDPPQCARHRALQKPESRYY